MTDERGQLVPWSGLDTGHSTQYPASSAPDVAPAVQPWETISHMAHYPNLPVCDPGCTEHSDTIHDIIRLLRMTRASCAAPGAVNWDMSTLEGLVPWKINTGSHPGRRGSASPLMSPTGRTVLWQFGGPVSPVIGDLPIDATKLNIMLIQTCQWHSNPLDLCYGLPCDDTCASPSFSSSTINSVDTPFLAPLSPLSGEQTNTPAPHSIPQP